MRRWFFTFCSSFMLLFLVVASSHSVGAASRTVDGDPSDWTGTPSATAHTDAESDGEWIYTGAADDARTDTGMDSNADLTEVRVTVDSTYLYLLFRLDDITDADEVHIAVGIDTDQDGYDTGYNWLGDESNLTMGRTFLYAERILSFHSVSSGNYQVEWWAGGSWYTISGTQISISAANDVVEARLPLSDLNGMDNTSAFSMTVATFQNNAGWNNDTDTTDDFTTTDAVDVMGIPGQTGNAWGRDLNDGNVYFGWWIELRGSSDAPTAVVWDRLYHSSCDQLVADNCSASDHPSEQYVPAFGDTVRFVSTRRWSDDGTLSPGGTTDVYAYDDESVDVYWMSHKGDLTFGGGYPRLRYYNGSWNWSAGSDAGDWSGAWGGTPTTNYDIVKVTIPAQNPRDIYYYPVSVDNIGERDLCRAAHGSGQEDHNWMNQWVHSSDCPSGTEYAYTVIDDDITAPTVENVNYAGGQVCANVYDTNSRSGDNDSGISSVQVRYSGTKSDVVDGSGGSTASMSSTGGNQYCASGLSFGDPTYYRVEAVNNDYDNSSTADRESGPSTTYCNGTCAGAGADGDIWWNEVYHDTRASGYRAPFGAVPTGQTIAISLRTANSDLTGATLYVYNTPSGTQAYAMTKRSESDPTYDWYDYTIPAGDTASIRTLYYKFKLTDGTDVDWYIDDYSHNSYDHEDRYENGTGMMVDDGEASQYANNSFNITVYDSAFTTPDWAKKAVIYQILPDRFRNGNPNNDNAWPYSTIYGTNEHLHTVWNEAADDPRDAGGSYYQDWSADFFGGDLQGIEDELDYLESIGVTAIYLNPIFDSPSNHGYDTTNYLKISPRLGTNNLFETFSTEAENRGISIILDGVFNHTGSDSVYFDRYDRWDASGNADTGADTSGACERESSSYNLFYTFEAGSGPCAGRTDGNEQYDSWWGYDSLPLLNENTTVKDYVFDYSNDDASPSAVIQYWYSKGADGWRFDVADEVGHSFWEDFRSQVKTNDGLTGPLYSEVWFEAIPWLYGNQMDATMNYRYRKAVLGFLIDSDWIDNDNNGDQTMWALSPSEFDYALGSIREDYPAPAWYAMMNLMGSHDTNRPLYVLYKQSSNNLTNALSKMEMMAALQFTYPGAPTIYYGDEVGLGAEYGSAGQWGAGKSVAGIVQDDPYNRHTYPWGNESGFLPAGLPNTDLRDTYRSLALIRNNYDVLQTGDVTTLLTDDVNQTYAYARTGGAPDCAIAIFNRDGSNAHDVNLIVPSECEDTTYYDVLNNSASYAATGSNLAMVNLPALSSAVLVPRFDNPNTADTTLSLPPASVNADSTATKISCDNSTNINATIKNVTGGVLPAGVVVDFQIISPASGGGSLGTSTGVTDGSGVAAVSYTAPSSGPQVVVIQASITAPSGVTYSDSATVFVGFQSDVSSLTTVETGIGPETVAMSSTLDVTKLGTGEPVITLAQLDNVPNAGGNKSVYVDIHLSSATDVDSLEIVLTYTDETNETDHKLYWYDGSDWLKIDGSTVDTVANTVGFTVTSGTTPSLSQLSGTPFVVGDGNQTPTAITLQAFSARGQFGLWGLLILAVLVLLSVVWQWRKANRTGEN